MPRENTLNTSTSRVSIRIMAFPADVESTISQLSKTMRVIGVRGPYRNRDPRDLQVRCYIEAEVNRS